jgi:hypothetical protein
LFEFKREVTDKSERKKIQSNACQCRLFSEFEF